MCAAQGNNVHVVEYLAEAVESLNGDATDCTGATALHHAASAGHPTMITALANVPKIELNARDKVRALHSCESVFFVLLPLRDNLGEKWIEVEAQLIRAKSDKIIIIWKLGEFPEFRNSNWNWKPRCRCSLDWNWTRQLIIIQLEYEVARHSKISNVRCISASLRCILGLNFTSEACSL